MDQRQILALIKQLQQRIDRSFEEDLRPLKREIGKISEELRTLQLELEQLKKAATQQLQILQELRQESEQAKKSNFIERTDLTVLKEQLVRIQQELKELISSTQQDPLKQADSYFRER